MTRTYMTFGINALGIDGNSVYEPTFTTTTVDTPLFFCRDTMALAWMAWMARQSVHDLRYKRNGRVDSLIQSNPEAS